MCKYNTEKQYQDFYVILAIFSAMQQLKARRRRWHYITSQHSVEHQGAIKYSFQTTQFEHVCYKVHRVGSGYYICFPCPHPQSLTSNCRTKLSNMMRDTRHLEALNQSAFPKYFHMYEGLSKSTSGTKFSLQRTQIFSGLLSFHHCWSSLTHMDYAADIAGSLNVRMVENSY